MPHQPTHSELYLSKDRGVLNRLWNATLGVCCWLVTIRYFNCIVKALLKNNWFCLNTTWSISFSCLHFLIKAFQVKKNITKTREDQAR